MKRAGMAWLGLALGLGLGPVLVGACGPTGSAAEDTEGDTEGSGSGSSTGDAGMTAASVSASSPSATNASMSGSGDDAPPMMTTGTPPDPDSTTAADGSEGESDATGCAPGQVDCPCDVGSTCDEGLECVEGTCVAPGACEEPEGEPNDDEAGAIDVGSLECGGDPIVLPGALNGTEQDWFTTVPMSGAVCFENPTATVTTEGDAEIAVCIFAVCANGGTNVGCGFGGNAGTPEMSPDGADGCCRTGSVELDSVTCQSISQDYTAWVRVSAAQDECLAYELTLDY